MSMAQARMSAEDAGLIAKIETARGRTANWLSSLQARGHPSGVLRISAHHDADRHPDILLPGTYNGLMCLALIGALDDWPRLDRRSLITWLETFRLVDGRFRMPSMRDDDVFKKPDLAETWRYIDWHVTNYSLGAIEMLDGQRRPQLSFAEPYLDPDRVAAWLAYRDLRDPWQEGNNIVNLTSFLLLLRRYGSPERCGEVDAALDVLFGWHDRNREPTTGFWGVGQLSDPARLLHAMAGSMHSYHLWYALDRPLEAQAYAADYCLSLPTEIDSACIDTDTVDVLVHAKACIGHRPAETEAWLRAKLTALLAFQNPDGGFADVREGVRRQDGWVKGYVEPQGLSNTFSTWFRWIAIAMIADALWPGRWPWRFRSMIGIGFRKARTP
jgi:hypothetical protein